MRTGIGSLNGVSALFVAVDNKNGPQCTFQYNIIQYILNIDCRFGANGQLSEWDTRKRVPNDVYGSSLEGTKHQTRPSIYHTCSTLWNVRLRVHLHIDNSIIFPIHLASLHCNVNNGSKGMQRNTIVMQFGNPNMHGNSVACGFKNWAKASSVD